MPEPGITDVPTAWGESLVAPEIAVAPALPPVPSGSLFTRVATRAGGFLQDLLLGLVAPVRSRNDTGGLLGMAQTGGGLLIAMALPIFAIQNTAALLGSGLGLLGAIGIAMGYAFHRLRQGVLRGARRQSVLRDNGDLHDVLDEVGDYLPDLIGAAALLLMAFAMIWPSAPLFIAAGYLWTGWALVAATGVAGFAGLAGLREGLLRLAAYGRASHELRDWDPAELLEAGSAIPLPESGGVISTP